MTDIATLGLKIDSSQAATGATNLDKLTAASNKAETAASKLGLTFKTSGVQAQDLLNNTNLSAAAKARLTAQLEKQGVATAAVTASSAGLAKGQAEATKGALGLASATGMLATPLEQADGSALKFVNTLTRRFILGFAISQIRGMAGAVGNLVFEMARVGDISKLTGMGNGQTQGIASLAGANGIDSKTIAEAMIAFNQQIPLAKAGVGELGALLRGNKISVTDTGDAFFKVADLVRNAKNDTEATNILRQAGLPATSEMLRLMRLGGDELREQIKLTSKLSDAQVDAAQKARDAWFTTWQKIKDGSLQAIGNLILRNQEITKQQNARNLTKDPSNFGLRFDVGTADLDSGNEKLRTALEKRAKILRDGPETVDVAARNAVRQKEISDAQQLLGLYGSTTTALEAQQAVQLQADAAALNNVHINGQCLALLKQLAADATIGVTAIKASADAQRTEGEAVGMSVGQAAAYTAAQNALNDAKRNGKTLTAENVEAIQRESDALGVAAQRTDNLKFGYDTFSGTMRDFGQQVRSVGLRFEALRTTGVNALGKIADKLMDMASQQLWNAAFGGKSGGGWLSSIFGGGGGGGGGAPAGASATASGVASINHSGYGPGDPPGPTRIVPSALFDDAPRFHTGIGPGERKAIIQETEGVFTKGQMKALAPVGSSTPVTIGPNYYDFSGADPGSEARMRRYVDDSHRNAVETAVQQVQTIHKNSPGNYMPRGG